MPVGPGHRPAGPGEEAAVLGEGAGQAGALVALDVEADDPDAVELRDRRILGLPEA
jgi:hypothetical protein